MTNPKAVRALLTGLLALAVLLGAGAAAHFLDQVGLVEAMPAVPLALVLALLSLSLSRRARFEHQRSLGRVGGAGLAATARGVGTVALILALTAALSLAVYAVLAFVLG